MDAEIERSSDKKYLCPVWVGSMEDLQKLAEAVERMAQARGKTLLADFDGQSERMIKEIDDDTSLEPDAKKIDKDVLRAQRDTERRRLGTRFQVTATLVDGDDTTKGPVLEVLAELDRRTVKSVEFSMRAGIDDEVKLSLDREGGFIDNYGAKLEVTSIDRGWANQVHAQISEEIDKGKPWYTWIRSGLGRIVVGGGVAVTIALTVVLLILPAFAGKDEPIAWLIGLGIVWLLGTVLIAADWPYKWLAPRFEITGEDGAPKGSRRIAALVAPLVALVIGVIVNLITG